jgi:hypothetical protein
MFVGARLRPARLWKFGALLLRPKAALECESLPAVAGLLSLS